MDNLKIDIGCGSSKKDGFLGIDIIPLNGVDIVHDLNQFPYPFSDSVASEIWMDNVLEHLEKPLLVIEEIYRIAKDRAKITIAVPYFRSFYSCIDPTHRNFFSVEYFNYFDPKHPFCQKYQYSKARFGVVKIEFDREWQGKMNLIHRMFVQFAEKHTAGYEAKLSHLLPLNSLTFHLETLK
jgi:predicted SAM-dependent methyltransferase